MRPRPSAGRTTSPYSSTSTAATNRWCSSRRDAARRRSRFETATVTVDWFHVVQLFTKAVDEVRRAEVKRSKLPKALRWAVLKRADGRLTEAQVTALAELEASDLFTAIAWRIKEKLRWVRQAQSIQAARWRITNFLRHASELLDPDPILDPVRRALAT